jgi:hypothetical protein
MLRVCLWVYNICYGSYLSYNFNGKDEFVELATTSHIMIATHVIYCYHRTYGDVDEYYHSDHNI